MLKQQSKHEFARDLYNVSREVRKALTYLEHCVISVEKTQLPFTKLFFEAIQPTRHVKMAPHIS